MSADEPETDEERVEWCRRHMQECLDRCDLDAATEGEILLSVGLPVQMLDVQLADMREIGRFDLSLPDRHWLQAAPEWWRVMLRRHWVYMHRDGSVHALSIKSRRQLLTTGSVRLQALTWNSRPQ